MNRALLVIALAAVVSSSSFAQIPGTPQAASISLVEAKALTEKEPTPKSLQVYGLLLCEAGRFNEAEAAFARAIELKPGQASPSGLENVELRNLRQYKGSFSRVVSEAAIRNNLGLVRLFLGKRAEAFAEFDKASVIDGGLSAPWLNGAVAWLQVGRYADADKNARQAKGRGDASATCLAVLAEAEAGLGLVDESKRDIAAALALEPDNATALAALAKISNDNGDFRLATKASAKALAASSTAFLGADLQRAKGTNEVFGGSVSEQHVVGDNHGFVPGLLAYSLGVKFDKLTVEDRREADQARGRVDLSFSSKGTSVVANYINFYGGKPGAEVSIAGIDPDPSERARFTNLSAFAVHSFGDLTLHGAYRRSQVASYSNVNPSQNLSDSEWLGEFRYQHASARDTKSIGFSYVTLNRSKSTGTVFEPSGQVLPDGSQQLWTGYAVDRLKLTGSLTFDAGLLVTGAEKNINLSPVLSLTRTVSAGSSVSFGLKPQVNPIAGNLIPDFLLAGDNTSNPIDRVQQTTLDFNRSPLLFGNQGRFDNFELKWDWQANALQQWQFCLFHTRFSDIYAQGADPRVASSLSLTPLADARATGLSVAVRQVLDDGSRLGGFVLLQSNTAEARFPTLDAGAWPGSVGVSDHRIPDVPALRAALTWTKPWDDFVASATLQYVGARLHAVTAAGSGLTYLQDADPATGLSVKLAKRLGPNSHVEATVFNLGRASFYPGYPGAPSILLGLVVRMP